MSKYTYMIKHQLFFISSSQRIPRQTFFASDRMRTFIINQTHFFFKNRLFALKILKNNKIHLDPNQHPHRPEHIRYSGSTPCLDLNKCDQFLK